MKLTTDTKTIENIKKFWDNKARQYKDSCKATLGEVRLRNLEIKTIIKYIKRFEPTTVLDVGCGNGYSTMKYARKFRNIKFYGVDYSSEMIDCAKKYNLINCDFYTADVLQFETLPQQKVDLVITQRCLQNLPTYDDQRRAIKNLLKLKKPDGHLLLMECSKNGVSQLNEYRAKLGRPALKNIEPWHNNFFIDENIISDFNANIDYFSSTYMYLSKVIHYRLARIAGVFPAIGKFGYDRLYIIKRDDY